MYSRAVCNDVQENEVVIGRRTSPFPSHEFEKRAPESSVLGSSVSVRRS